MRKTAQAVALGGMMSALAVVIMCLGTIVPIATFICPAFAMITGQITVCFCGRKFGWCWYGVVTILSLLLSFDKEAAVTFTFLGYYPMIKFWFDRYRIGWIGKLVYFNFSIAIMYFLLLQLLGMADLAGEYAELGKVGILMMLIMGNITFFMLDIILSRFSDRK
jgi:hypothetical protein